MVSVLVEEGCRVTHATGFGGVEAARSLTLSGEKCPVTGQAFTVTVDSYNFLKIQTEAASLCSNCPVCKLNPTPESIVVVS